MRAGSDSHEARKALFQTGIRRGWLDLAEIDRALPAGSLSPPENPNRPVAVADRRAFVLPQAGVVAHDGPKDGD